MRHFKNSNLRQQWGVYCTVLAVGMSFSTIASSPVSASLEDGSTATGGIVSTRPYTLAPNDQLNILVAGHDELKLQVSILPDGTFDYPGVGTVNAAGMTVSSLTHYLTVKLSRTINQPDVTVSVASSASQKASVVGAVRDPGQYPIQPNSKILDVIAAAGGLASDPEVTQATLIKSTGGTVDVDVAGLLDHENMALNLPVEPGDVLLVQAGQMQQVQLTGDVQKPGSYPAGKDGETTSSLIAQAGGPMPDAALSQAQILHNGTVQNVDLRPIKTDLNSPAANIRLLPGDVLQIPAVTSKIAVLGDVRQPGSYPLPDGLPLSVTSAVALAGGTADSADLLRVTLLQRDAQGKAILTKINLADIMSGKSPNITLEPDEIVYVPTTKSDNKLGEISPLFYPLGLLAAHL